MQSFREYSDGYPVFVGEDGHFPLLGVADSDGEREGFTARPQADGDVIETSPQCCRRQLFSPLFLLVFSLVPE